MIVGLIPDGNRRYAEKQGIPRIEGFRRGAETLRDFFDFCSRKHISTGIIYALSEDNLNRTVDELKELFTVYEEQFLKYLHPDSEAHRRRVRFTFYSTQPNMLPTSLKAVMRQLTKATKAYTNHHLKILMAWDARHELLNACLKVARKPRSKMESFLMVKDKPNLIIRTGHHQRLSGFLSVQARYSELYFIKKLFPECIEEDWKNALSWYSAQQKKFGR
ncbi:MAG: polyprenyl diphosphate synthase [Candidatus Bathyarchaeota archaeon]